MGITILSVDDPHGAHSHLILVEKDLLHENPDPLASAQLSSSGSSPEPWSLGQDRRGADFPQCGCRGRSLLFSGLFPPWVSSTKCSKASKGP